VVSNKATDAPVKAKRAPRPHLSKRHPNAPPESGLDDNVSDLWRS